VTTQLQLINIIIIRYSDSLYAGRFGDLNLRGSPPVQAGREALPASCTIGTGSLSWG